MTTKHRLLREVDGDLLRDGHVCEEHELRISEAISPERGNLYESKTPLQPSR